ncbi:MAG TPA: hypothetical protein ENN79_06825 [Desulfobacteraceae bacterium]|nr:hypothetical protein [Desulfobacteraceae bacterium]
MFRKYCLMSLLIMAGFMISACPAGALVNYESGQLEINGVLLLQDAGDPNAYYYLPPAPRVSTKPDGSLELSVVKFIDPDGETSGGLFHILVAFSLPPDELEALRKELKSEQPDAKLLGPVPLQQDQEGSFAIISGTLSDEGFTESLISSGKAPVTPGSKAAVAATLTPHGATLLWDSLNRPTSDVSIALSAYYEAILPSFNARIHADVSTVYTHFSKVQSVKKRYTKRQIRDIVDELVRTGTVEIDVLDRLPEDTASQAMQALVDMVSTKLTEIIFDTTTGFTAVPEKEAAVEKGQIKGRQKKGWLAKLFTGTGNQKYYTDDQYVLKQREDINRAVFSINLTRRSVVKVPVYTAGNISGLYQEFKDNPRLFRVVNLADPAFQKRDIYFCIDGDFSGAFEDMINFAGVAVRKAYSDHDDATGEVMFTREDIREGHLSKSWTYARLGQSGEDWLNYRYRTNWSIQGRHTISDPADTDSWNVSSNPMVTIAPPLRRLDLEIDADRFLFENADIRSAMIEVRYHIFGQVKTERLAVMRATDADSFSTAAVFHDPEDPVEYRVNWYSRTGKSIEGEWIPLESSYLVLVPPEL